MEESRLESYLATKRVHFWLERRDASERRTKSREEQRVRAEKTTLMERNRLICTSSFARMGTPDDMSTWIWICGRAVMALYPNFFLLHGCLFRFSCHRSPF